MPQFSPFSLFLLSSFLLPLSLPTYLSAQSLLCSLQNRSSEASKERENITHTYMSWRVEREGRGEKEERRGRSFEKGEGREIRWERMKEIRYLSLEAKRKSDEIESDIGTELVVAWCREDLSWITSVARYFNRVTVYGKCKRPVKHIISGSIRWVYISHFLTLLSFFHLLSFPQTFPISASFPFPMLVCATTHTSHTSSLSPAPSRIGQCFTKEEKSRCALLSPSSPLLPLPLSISLFLPLLLLFLPLPLLPLLLWTRLTFSVAADISTFKCQRNSSRRGVFGCLSTLRDSTPHLITNSTDTMGQWEIGRHALLDREMQNTYFRWVLTFVTVGTLRCHGNWSWNTPWTYIGPWWSSNVTHWKRWITSLRGCGRFYFNQNELNATRKMTERSGKTSPNPSLFRWATPSSRDSLPSSSIFHINCCLSNAANQSIFRNYFPFPY